MGSVRTLGVAVLLFVSAVVCLSATQSPRGAVRVASEKDGASILTRPARLHVSKVPLITALVELHHSSGAELFFSSSLLPKHPRVSCDCRTVTVAEALDHLLDGLQLRYVELDRYLVIEPAEGLPLQDMLPHMPTPEPRLAVFRPTLSVRVRQGAIAGRVTETQSGAPLASVNVFLEGTRFVAVTGADGRFRIANVPPGEYTIIANRIGYAESRESVQVVAEQTTEVNFSLELQPTVLDEVVVTATGDQERRAIGNVIGRINGDSVTRLQPIMDVSQLLSGRTAGVTVIQGPGTVGAGPVLRIRGVNSLSLRNDPLVIVDGARIETGSMASTSTTFGTTRLSTFNVDEIESIDVIKGPSAAALYGTAAANGVLLITTKRGRVGRTSWRAYFETGQLQQRADWRNNYQSWGRNIDSATGQPVGSPIHCRIQVAAAGGCVVDSLTVFNPMMNPETTPFRDQPRTQFGLQASGGTDNFTFFVAGDIENDTGPYEMPANEVARLTELNGSAPLSEQIHPNAMRQISVRGNFGLDIGQNARVGLSTGYVDRRQRTPFDNGFFQGLTFQATSAPGYRTAANGNALQHTGDIFSVTTEQEDRRFTGSINADYNPFGWLTLRAAGGVDHSAGHAFTLQRLGQGVNTGWGNLVGRNGGKDVRREINLRYSLDAGATATRSLTSTLDSRTSVGVQYFRDVLEATFGDGFDLLPGSTTLTAAARRTTGEETIENATYGAYLEETLSWNDRLYVTGGLRTDKNSAFGFRQGTVLYPRGSLSWVISEEPFFPQTSAFDEARLRFAWGKAGVQPAATAALAYYEGGLVPIGPELAPALEFNSLGNPTLKPETTTETELGFDLSFLDRRLSIEATWFNKKSDDALVQVELPPSIAAGFRQFQNLGQVQNRGYELSIDLHPVRTRTISWDVRLSGSHVDNKVLSLGNVPVSPNQGARHVPGYPINALWARRIISWDDADQNGILTESEVVVSDTLEFVGPQIPVREASLVNNIGLFDGQLLLNAQIDYKGGHYTQWNMERSRCTGSVNCRAVNDPSAPLDEQAAAVAANSSLHGRTNWGYYRKKDYIRLREVSATYSLPRRFAERIGATGVSLTFSGRNVAPAVDRLSGSRSGSDAHAPEQRRRIRLRLVLAASRADLDRSCEHPHLTTHGSSSYPSGRREE